MSSKKLSMENFILQETLILEDRDAQIKALKEREKKVYADGRNQIAKLMQEAKESGLFKLRFGDYLRELERVAFVLPGTVVPSVEIREPIEGDIRRAAVARAFDNSAETEKNRVLKIILYCNHSGNSFFTSFDAPFTLLNNNFADGTRFRENLNIDVREEGGEVMSYISLKKDNIENMIVDLSGAMEPGMMRECRDALISCVKKQEKKKGQERTK